MSSREHRLVIVELRVICRSCEELTLVRDPGRPSRCDLCGHRRKVSRALLDTAMEAARIELPQGAPEVRHLVHPGALVTIRCESAVCGRCAGHVERAESQWTCTDCEAAYVAANAPSELFGLRAAERYFVPTESSGCGFGLALRRSESARLDAWDVSTAPLQLLSRRSEDMPTR